MIFTYRLKFYKNELGKYTEPVDCDLATIEDIISTYWVYKTKKGLEVISVTNSSGQSLMLEHSNKDVFEVYYLPLTKKYFYCKKSYMKLVRSSLTLFMNGKMEELEQSLHKTKKDNAYVRGDFFYIDHLYRLTPERNKKELSWLWWAMPGGLIFLVPLWFVILKGSDGPVIGAIIMFFLSFLYWLPGILIHRQYQEDTKDLKVCITQGEEVINIETSFIQATRLKSDIKRVVKIHSLRSKIPWSNYGYTEIEFESGEIINLTNLMVDQSLMHGKFLVDTIEYKEVEKGFPFLRRQTYLKLS